MIVKKLIVSKLISVVLIVCMTSCLDTKTANKETSSITDSCQLHSESDTLISRPDGTFKAYKTKSPIVIDGCNSDAIWSNVDWYAMNHVWMGEEVDTLDYHGKFKLAWDDKQLYILVEVIDEHLNATLANGLEQYWKGDYVEVFIDEDRSGGNHKFNHQAFAYHVSTEGHAIDKSTTEATIFFDDHIDVKRSQEGHKYLWEMAIRLYDDRFDENAAEHTAVRIENRKQIGFSIAYGDNDGNDSRENFMGSKASHGINNDEGYVNADVFGSIVFLEQLH